VGAANDTSTDLS